MKNSKKTVTTSMVKAVLHAFVIPVSIMIAMLFIDRSYSVAAALGWLFFANVVYFRTKTKQLTAFFFFRTELVVLAGITMILILFFS